MPPFDKMTENEVCDLLRDGGAEIVPLAAAAADAAVVCVASRHVGAQLRRGAAPAGAIVDQRWLLDSISHYSVRETAAYLVGAAAASGGGAAAKGKGRV